MKIVILSDIHGNYDALSSLPEKYDQLWVLGDLVNYGPQPAEVIDFVRRQATHAVRGNHDHCIGFDEDPCCSPRFREMAEATKEQATDLVLRMLVNLRSQVKGVSNEANGYEFGQNTAKRRT